MNKKCIHNYEIENLKKKRKKTFFRLTFQFSTFILKRGGKRSVTDSVSELIF